MKTFKEFVLDAQDALTIVEDNSHDGSHKDVKASNLLHPFGELTVSYFPLNISSPLNGPTRYVHPQQDNDHKDASAKEFFNTPDCGRIGRFKKWQQGWSILDKLKQLIGI